ncbi:hypothetical protein Tco_0851336 [Tanacetum coccineum]
MAYTSSRSSSSSDNEVYDDSFCSKSCRKNTKNLNNKIIKLNEELSDCETDLYNYKRGLSQVEARLVEFKNNEIKFCERIRVLERDIELKDNKIKNLSNELEKLKKEKESIDFKIENFENASKDLDILLGIKRLDKDMKGLGFMSYRPTPIIDVPRDKTKVNAATEVSAAVEFNVGAEVNVDYSNRRLKKNTENLNNKVIKLNKELSDCETDLYNYKRGLSQVEARLVEFKNNEIKFCERIRVLERDLELRDNKIGNLRNELEEVKKEKESIDFKIEKFDNASKDLDSLLGNKRLDKDKKGLGFNEFSVVFTPSAPYRGVQRDVVKVFLSLNKEDQLVMLKPTVKYAKMYKSQRPRGNQRNWNNQKSQQLGSDFVMIKKACYMDAQTRGRHLLMSMINNLMQEEINTVGDEEVDCYCVKLKCTQKRVEQRQSLKRKAEDFQSRSYYYWFKINVAAKINAD